MSIIYPKLPYCIQPEFTKEVEVLKGDNNEVLVYAFEYHNDKEGYVLYFTENSENLNERFVMKCLSTEPFMSTEFNKNLINYLKFYLEKKSSM